MNNERQPTNVENKNYHFSQKNIENAVDQLSSNGVQTKKINIILKKDRREHIDFNDIVQIIIGSFAAAIVFAPTSELISLSQSLPSYKLIIIFIFTLIFIGLLAYGVGGRHLHLKEIQTIGRLIPVRLVFILILSLISCLMALWIYDVIRIDTPILEITRRVVVLLLPTTWGGTLIDLIHSKHR